MKTARPDYDGARETEQAEAPRRRAAHRRGCAEAYGQPAATADPSAAARAGLVLRRGRPARQAAPARKISKIRLLRPVIAAAVIIPFFVDRPATRGTALAVEIAGVAAGLLCGLAASALMSVYRSPTTGKPVSR